MDNLPDADPRKMEWEDKNSKLEKELTTLQFQKKFWILHNKKLVTYLKKMAVVSRFKGFMEDSRETPISEDSICGDIVPNELLDQLFEHIRNKFEGGSGGPPGTSSNKALVSPEPPVTKLVTDQGHSSSATENSPSASSSTSSSSKSSGSSLKRQQPKKKKSKKSSYEDDNEFQPGSRPQPRKAVKRAKVIMEKIAIDAHVCKKTWNSKNDRDEHNDIVFKVLEESRNHNQSNPVRLPKSPDQMPPPPPPPPPPPDTQPSEAQLLPGLVNCDVCGDPFGSMAALNFHIKKKHGGRGGGGGFIASVPTFYDV